MYACIFIKRYFWDDCAWFWVLYNLQISRVQTFGPSSLWEATRRKMVQGHVFTNSSTTSAPYVHLDTSRFQTVLPKLEPLGSMTSIKVLWGFWNMFKLVWTIRMWKRDREHRPNNIQPCLYVQSVCLRIPVYASVITGACWRDDAWIIKTRLQQMHSVLSRGIFGWLCQRF